ncbi:MAG: hypothetical protein AAGD25_10060 [Cyanobacteria bacterium P01_F01_bin.150]
MTAWYEVSNVGQFLGRIANIYIWNGYTRYAVRHIPSDKSPQAVDTKILSCYHITQCRMTRMRHAARGEAKVGYIRFGRTFILVATTGKHKAFGRIQSHDFYTSPLHYYHYSVGIRNQKPCIRIAHKTWKWAEHRISKMALHDHDKVQQALQDLPYYNFVGVQEQKRHLIAHINARRKRAGLPLISNQNILPKDGTM